MNIRTKALLFSALSAISGACAADTPISTPLTTKFCSASGSYCATSNAKNSITIIQKQSAPKTSVAWSVPDFISWGYISDDGTIVASCYPDKNLVPIDSRLNLSVVKFYNRKEQHREITLGDIYKSMTELPVTESHRYWGYCLGFDRGDFEVMKANNTIWKIGNIFANELLK